MEITSSQVASENDKAFDENSNITFDATLNYLNKILLEEEIHEKDFVHQDGPALWSVEKPFYDIVGQKYPICLNELSLLDQPLAYPTSSNVPLQIDSSSGSGFNNGMDEGMNFLPSIGKIAINFQANKGGGDCVEINLDKEENEDLCFTTNRSRSKKKSNGGDLDLTEGRNCKIPIPYLEEPARDTTFDEVLVYCDNHTKEVAGLREIMQTSSCNKKKIQERVSDVKDLLIQCSRSIAANDRQIAERLIKEIRKQCSPDGDGNQRLAHVLANALEARLTGTGSETYNRFVAKRIPTTHILKVYHLYMTATPFPDISFYFTNQSILKAVDKASKVHIIDFGIDYGFQWPSLIRVLSNQKGGGVIKLRITGIEIPRPGFRPAELVEETGRRLKEYAKMFNVPFEYHGIATQWETIRVNDFKIEKDEMLIVNCMNRFRQLGDETTGLDCPRDKVLKLIREIRPHIFIYEIFNWSVSPFFVTRFKQVMSLYDFMFDLLDTLIPRDNKVRQMIEQDMLARDAINFIACEGSNWIERPETFQQWHRRTLRAGFEQLPLDPTIVKKCNGILRKVYDDNRFFIEEESGWFLQGWRGRILYAHSIWKPK